MEPQPDSEELITPVLNFKIDVGQIQVPVTIEYPNGLGVLLMVATPVNSEDPASDWVTEHYLMPPGAARAIGEGITATGTEATGIIVP